MNENEFINMLIEALKVKKVRDEIKKIFASEKSSKIKNKNESTSKETTNEKKIIVDMSKKIKEMNEEIDERNEIINRYKSEYNAIAAKSDRIKKELNNAEEEIQALKRRNVELERITTNLNNEINNKNEEINRIKAKEKYAEMYKNRYGAINDCFELYKGLSDEIHRDLSRVLNCENVEKFIYGGVQWENIEALWDSISYQLDKYSREETETLKKIFDFLFEAYISINGRYERLKVNAGDEFDEEIHTRGPNSPHVSGHITYVWLRGYKGIKNNKIKKSIVII